MPKPAISSKSKKNADEKLNRAAELLDNLVRAAETQDQNSIVQAAAAGREWLDTDGNR